MNSSVARFQPSYLILSRLATAAGSRSAAASARCSSSEPSGSGPAPGTGGFAGEKSNQPQTYMQYDLAALQYMYGANYTTNATDTVYSWSATTGEMFVNGVGQGAPSGNKILMTIWDGGGTDTLDLSNYGRGVTVDLRPGAFSTLDQTQLANHLAYQGLTALAPGNVAMSLLYNNDARSLIENAKGGDGNDIFVGNIANNHAGDAGQKGRRETIGHLEAAGVHVTGAVGHVDDVPVLGDQVRLAAQRQARVRAVSGLPLTEEEQGEVRVEVASDAAFKVPVLSGTARGGFVNVTPPARGSLHWRVRKPDGSEVARGSASFGPERSTKGELDRLRNRVPEGPEKTTIFFQDKQVGRVALVVLSTGNGAFCPSALSTVATVPARMQCAQGYSG